MSLRLGTTTGTRRSANFGADFRRRAGLTQEDAGHILGVDMRTWRRWEMRENTPTAPLIVALAEALDLADEELGRLMRWWGSP
mgnify:CR=1 FL=1